MTNWTFSSSDLALPNWALFDRDFVLEDKVVAVWACWWEFWNTHNRWTAALIFLDFNLDLTVSASDINNSWACLIDNRPLEWAAVLRQSSVFLFDGAIACDVKFLTGRVVLWHVDSWAMLTEFLFSDRLAWLTVPAVGFTSTCVNAWFPSNEVLLVLTNLFTCWFIIVVTWASVA